MSPRLNLIEKAVIFLKAIMALLSLADSNFK
jgi:hypothetical protein